MILYCGICNLKNKISSSFLEIQTIHYLSFSFLYGLLQNRKLPLRQQNKLTRTKLQAKKEHKVDLEYSDLLILQLKVILKKNVPCLRKLLLQKYHLQLPKLLETLRDSFFFLSSHHTNDEDHLSHINIFGDLKC